jgi:hypothetical protein
VSKVVTNLLHSMIELAMILQSSCNKWMLEEKLQTLLSLKVKFIASGISTQWVHSAQGVTLCKV